MHKVIQSIRDKKEGGMLIKLHMNAYDIVSWKLNRIKSYLDWMIYGENGLECIHQKLYFLFSWMGNPLNNLII